ncbi:MAG: hypothetical protein HY719_17535 [Planctomycetes bacterium]|nr:hypothetical protein [Planctomycetota bacterium]
MLASLPALALTLALALAPAPAAEISPSARETPAASSPPPPRAGATSPPGEPLPLSEALAAFVAGWPAFEQPARVITSPALVADGARLSAAGALAKSTGREQRARVDDDRARAALAAAQATAGHRSASARGLAGARSAAFALAAARVERERARARLVEAERAALDGLWSAIRAAQARADDPTADAGERQAAGELLGLLSRRYDATAVSAPSFDAPSALAGSPPPEAARYPEVNALWRGLARHDAQRLARSLPALRAALAAARRRALLLAGGMLGARGSREDVTPTPRVTLVDGQTLALPDYVARLEAAVRARESALADAEARERELAEAGDALARRLLDRAARHWNRHSAPSR